MRRALLPVLVAVALLGRAAPVQARPSFGDFVKAARAADSWRLDEARSLTAALASGAPDQPETRYLVAQLAYLDGEYARAAEILAGLNEPSLKELVADLKPLVSSTIETTKGFARREFAHFVISYEPGKDEVLVEAAGEALEAARAALVQDLGWAPSGKVRVEILPRITDLARLSTLTEKDIETSGTIALCKYNKLMVVSPRATLFGYPWLDTLAHEYTHFVVSSATGDRVPIWLHEGIAKFQESRWRATPGAGGLGHDYAALLGNALRKGRLITFEEMHPSMAKLPSQEAAATAFAEVYTMVAYLHGKVGYAGLRGVLSRIKDGQTERRAIAEVVGGTWPDVEQGWRAYLKKLDLPSGSDEKARAPRVRFRKGGKEADSERDENVGLELVSVEKARRHARLGGLLRARGRLAAAAIEYEKALAEGPRDRFVAAKLARTLLDLGNADRAIEVMLPLYSPDSDDALPGTTLGLAYLKKQEPAKAEPHLLAAFRLSPFDPAVRCGLAEVYATQRRPELADRERRACQSLGGQDPSRDR